MARLYKPNNPSQECPNCSGFGQISKERVNYTAASNLHCEFCDGRGKVTRKQIREEWAGYDDGMAEPHPTYEMLI
ncbi:MAG: hypothetical protein MSG64_16815 [Pyrinomonadaceae bacterium MAG19_C2-C3]|nr:hypothetical protein [Pyrinomonadaceae bacterium MAG19_C2-C3]